MVKSLSKWKILSNLAFFFYSVYKTNIDCFLFGAQFKIIGPRWCQNHDYALSFASGIVMDLTSPRAYDFNCAPQSSQYLYTISFAKILTNSYIKYKYITWFYIKTSHIWTIHAKTILRTWAECKLSRCTHPDSSDQLQSHITRYRCGYCKLEYHWGYSEGTMQLL